MSEKSLPFRAVVRAERRGLRYAATLVCGHQVDCVNLDNVIPCMECSKSETTSIPGAMCSVCGNQQYSTPSGPTCEQGHGGAPSLAPGEVIVGVSTDSHSDGEDAMN